MSMLDKLQEERDAKIAFIDELLTNVESESRDLVDAEQRNLDAARERIAEIDAQIKPIREFEELRSSPVAHLTRRTGDTIPAQRRGEPATAGDVFVRSAAYRDFQARGYGRSDVVDVPMWETRAPQTTGDWGVTPGLVVPRPAGLYTPVSSSLSVVTVSAPNVDYVTYSAASDAVDVNEGSAKPEAVLTPTPVSATLPTQAHWSDVTRQLMEDSTAVTSLIEGELMRGVARKIEANAAAAINGGSYTETTNADMLAAIREAKGKVEVRGFMPDTLFINPADLAALDIQVMNNAGLAAVQQQSYFGLKVVPTAGITLGTTVVADAMSAFMHFQRTTIQVYVDMSTGFKSNYGTILAEARTLTAVVHPDAAESTAPAL